METEFSPSITLGRRVGSSSSRNQTGEKCFSKEMDLSEFLICKNKKETVATRKEENKTNKGTLN